MSQVGRNSASESVGQSLTTKSWPNFCLKILTKFQPWYLEHSSASRSLPNCCKHVPHHQNQLQLQHQQVLSWHIHTLGLLHQSSLLNRSKWVTAKGRQWSDMGPIKSSKIWLISPIGNGAVRVYSSLNSNTSFAWSPFLIWSSTLLCCTYLWALVSYSCLEKLQPTRIRQNTVYSKQMFSLPNLWSLQFRLCTHLYKLLMRNKGELM